jgi:hypothetical protein
MGRREARTSWNGNEVNHFYLIDIKADIAQLEKFGGDTLR